MQRESERKCRGNSQGNSQGNERKYKGNAKESEERKKEREKEEDIAFSLQKIFFSKRIKRKNWKIHSLENTTVFWCVQEEME